MSSDKKPSKLQDVNNMSVDFMVEARTRDLQDALTQSSSIIQVLMKEKKELELKVSHLEGLLMSQPSNLSLNIPSEEQICVEQINHIRSKSRLQELNLEDTKKLETFVKTLQSIRKEATTTINVKSSNLSPQELLSIVTSNDENQ